MYLNKKISISLMMGFIVVLFLFVKESKANDSIGFLPVEITRILDSDLNEYLGIVTPQMYGAVGDGIQDDSDSLKKCITYAKENGYIVFLPIGTYVVSPSVLQFELYDGESIVILGCGQNSCIKRKDNSLREKWSQIFTFIINPKFEPAHDVQLNNFCIDSNRRNQSNATDGHEYEASMDISIRNGKGISNPSRQYLDRFVVKDMRFYDPVADCINISGSKNINIKNILLDGIIATGRGGTRNDIGITANPLGDVFITNCNVSSMHYEYNGDIDDEDIICYHVNNSVFGAFSIAGRLDMICEGIIVNKYIIFYGVRDVKISNSTVALGNKNYFISPQFKSNIAFTNVIFKSRLNDTKATYIFIRNGINCICQECSFLYTGEYNLDTDRDGVTDHIDGYPLELMAGADSCLTLNQCKVDNGFWCSVYNNGSRLIMKNMLIETYYMIRLHVLENYNNCYMRFENVELGDRNKYLFSLLSIVDDFVIDGEINCTNHDFYVGADPTRFRDYFFKHLKGDFSRVFNIDGPYDYSYLRKNAPESEDEGCICTFFKGDRFIYIGNDYKSMPDEWVINKTGVLEVFSPDGDNESSMTINDIITSIGSGFGSTLERPDCILSIGYSYFDTDLQMPIFWNGLNWVKANGDEV